MGESKTVTERNAIIAVQRYIESDWFSRWQEFEARNDDGIDGIIMLRKKRLDRNVTGLRKKQSFTSHPIRGTVFAQVKGGESYAGRSEKRPGFIEIKLGSEYIEKHRPRWDATDGPVILVYVDTKNKKQNLDAWWTDLKDNSNYPDTNKQIVLVPESQKFGPHSKGHIRNLIPPAVQYDTRLQVIETEKADFSHVPLDGSLKKSAHDFYREWSGSSPEKRTNPKLGEVTVSRVGWRHITRTGRRKDRIVQSFQLLGVARRMIKEVDNVGWLGRMQERRLKSGATQRRELLGLRALVKFPFRHETVVQVILERKRIYVQKLEAEQIWFYSVYEARRGV